ncbi:cytochrome c peroxidase [Flavobacterium sp. SUN052]|uniref:cytochrome-c peroxidase n=1 Tax=Flavobacterium sp. SUN052 TaxID=3002441 RepID=UPI00237EA9A7|nr:cytochrome c peroxidase [Flavobacterium sp. SUN052]MEC4005714.1 cytochrome c peroxidase [Flavobacterium sp. SUN052]
MKANYFILLFIAAFSASCNDDRSEYTTIPTDKIEIGKAIFTDTNLSNPIGQACASCHSPEKAFSDPNNNAITQGAMTNAFGNRNVPSLSYNVFAPTRYYNATDETYIGGLFLDGRSNTLQEQFIHPMLNPIEMNNSSITEVALKIKNAAYFNQIVSVYGATNSDTELLSFVADALARYQKSREVNSFTSKFDYASKGLVAYTEDEKKGLNIFKDKGKCAQCHILDGDENTGKVLFTDFSYDNIGVPRNTNNPFYNQPSAVNPLGANYVDLGIGAIVNEPQHNGKFKVPTLRNIAITAPYFHNGSFTTLKQVIHFYNVRDLNTGEFGPPEYNQNVNTTELGDLKLTETEELQLEKFLLTLTDHYRE